MDLNNPITSIIPSLEGRVLEVLARTTEPLSGSRVAALVPSASNPGVRRSLSRLENQGLVEAHSAPPAVLYRANRRHLLWPAIEQLMLGVGDVEIALGALIERLVVDELGTVESRYTAVALFGSTARGDNEVDSDIDLLVVTREAEDADSRITMLISRLVDEVEAATGNETNVYAVSRARLDELVARGDPMVESWAADARTLTGPDVRHRLRGGAWRG